MMNTNDSTAQLIDQAFEALANEHRRQIIYHLSLQPATISQLANERQLSLPAIHKHIKVLESAGLIMRKKSGRCNFLALSSNGLSQAQAWLNQFHAYWGSDSQTLDNYIKYLNNKQ